MFEVFEARTTDNLNQLLPFFLFKRVFLQMIFCWMLFPPFDEPFSPFRTICYTAANSVGMPFNGPSSGHENFPGGKSIIFHAISGCG